MKAYANFGGKSSVRYYEYGNTYITVQFKSGSPYTYSYSSAGELNVETMKWLADSGQGLGSYIMRNCRNLYER